MSRRNIIIFLVVCAWTGPLIAQEINLKQAALEAFEDENYPKALSLLIIVVDDDPGDAEAYYYLGYITHHLYYDSVPFTGYDGSKSEEVLAYLRKAVKLNPKLGNAFYFIGVEYGVRFLNYMRKDQFEKAVLALRRGREEGGFPDWLVEYNRNMLNSCLPDAILFTGGDSDTKSAWYLQYVENFRRDVTVIPISLLNRPWYVLTIKEKSTLSRTPVPISWSEDQILSMHPYKWKDNRISIPISEDVREKYRLGDDVQRMEWLVEPNLFDERQSYLSPDRTVMIDIIKTNAWKRPIYFSVGCAPDKKRGLENYLQLSGMVYRLLPVKKEGNAPSLDVQRTEEVILNLENLRYVSDVTEKDYSRIDGIVKNYLAVYMHLVRFYQQIGDVVKARRIFKTIQTTLSKTMIFLDPEMSKLIESLEQTLKEKRHG